MTKAVARREAAIPASSPLNRTQSEAGAIVQVIERAALNPEVDVEKMERLFALQERVLERAAKAAFIEAQRLVKRQLPIIAQNGRILIKNRSGEVIQDTPYAKYEDIDAIVTPILDEHSMVLSFRTAHAADGRLIVKGVLSHTQGHEEETELLLPMDSSGSKNGVQAVGSSLSYGKRYAAGALLNLVSAGEDDDGQLGGQLPSAYAAKKTEMGDRCADLANEIKELESLAACTAWGNARAAEISAMPKNWQNMLREDLISQKAFIREQEGRTGNDLESFRSEGSGDLARDDSDVFPGDRPVAEFA